MTILDDCKEGKPGEMCRAELRGLSVLVVSDPISDMRQALQQDKTDLANERDGSKIAYRRRVIYHRAMGLLAYGDLDALKDVLDHATSPQVLTNRGGQRLLWFLPCLLPLPEEFGYRRAWGKITPGGEPMIWITENQEKIRQWYRQNKANLYWDAEAERYLLQPES